MMPTKNILIAIPTFRRKEELTRLLHSLAAQTDIPEAYNVHVLIVNNDPVGYAQEVIASMPDTFFAIHHIDVTLRGLSNVRNAAVSWVLNHEMDAMIFVDDDEMVPPRWLNHMINVWQRSNADIVTGPVKPILPLDTPKLVAFFSLHDPNFKAASGTRIQYANSNNTLVSANVLKTIGPSFETALNHTGGEDTLFFHQCFLKGFTIVWDNSILIFEPIPPDRNTAFYVFRRWFHQGMNRISINQVLYPNTWRKVSMDLMGTTVINLARGFPSSLIKKQRKKFGRCLCRSSWLLGVLFRFLGMSTINRIYNS